MLATSLSREHHHFVDSAGEKPRIILSRILAVLAPLVIPVRRLEPIPAYLLVASRYLRLFEIVAKPHLLKLRRTDDRAIARAARPLEASRPAAVKPDVHGFTHKVPAPPNEIPALPKLVRNGITAPASFDDDGISPRSVLPARKSVLNDCVVCVVAHFVCRWFDSLFLRLWLLNPAPAIVLLFLFIASKHRDSRVCPFLRRSNYRWIVFAGRVT